MKKIITIVSLFIVCSLGVGCSQYAKVETEPASIMVPLSESTEPSKEEPSAESGKVTTGSSEPQAEDQAGSTRTEKKEIINNLKKQAEDEAEQDRHFILEALGDEGADGRWSEACGFIQDQYPDYFSSDELLQVWSLPRFHLPPAVRRIIPEILFSWKTRAVRFRHRIMMQFIYTSLAGYQRRRLKKIPL